MAYGTLLYPGAAAPVRGTVIPNLIVVAVMPTWALLPAASAGMVVRVRAEEAIDRMARIAIAPRFLRRDSSIVFLS